MKKISKIPWEISRLSTPEGFIEAYYEYLPNSDGAAEAFYKVCDVHMEWYGYERYASYDSFRKVRDKRVKKKG